MSHHLLPTTLLAALLVSICNLIGAAMSRREVKLPASKRINIETTLALGKPVPLSRCELPDLELIPTIGPATAQKLFNSRTELLEKARILKDPALALLSIKGIGPATAEKIAPWLVFE